MFTVKFPVVVVVYVATSLVSKDKYKKALSDRAGPQGMLAALPRSLAGFKGAASRHERTGKGIQERNKRGRGNYPPSTGGRAFPVAGAEVWNGLPSDVTSASSLSVFKNRLKTYLFRLRCYETVRL